MMIKGMAITYALYFLNMNLNIMHSTKPARDTANMRIHVCRKSSASEYISNDMRFIMAAGIIPAAIFFAQNEVLARGETMA